MLRGLEGWHIVLIAALVVLLFGSRKLPDAARSIGQSLRIFKSEMKAAAKDGDAEAKKEASAQAVEGKVFNQSVNDSVPHNTGVSQS